MASMHVTRTDIDARSVAEGIGADQSIDQS
jgi:hypothetical protein